MRTLLPLPARLSLVFLLPWSLALTTTAWISAQTENPPPSAEAPAPVPGPSPATTVPAANTMAQPATAPVKTCFQCKGAKKTKCAACVNGETDCTAPCLKLSTPGWRRLNIPGHSPDELWMTYPDDDGKGSYNWTQKHIGQIVKRQNGRATITEICTVCKGKSKIKCTACSGSGVSVCLMCEGSGTVPTSWTALDNPKMKNRPGRFKLKDGTEVIGRKVIETQDTLTVRTQDGTVDIKIEDLAPDEPAPSSESPSGL